MQLKQLLILTFCLCFSTSTFAQNLPDLKFDFNQQLKDASFTWNGASPSFAEGLEGQSLVLQAKNEYQHLSLEGLKLDGRMDFSVQFWVKTNAQNPMVLLSQKDFKHKGIKAQQNAGWVLYTSGGNLGWSVGSGDRRINYERDNGMHQPLCDDNWHQISLTFNKTLSEFRLYYDGHNIAFYKVQFDFSNDEPLRIGSLSRDLDYENMVAPDIKLGQGQLQALVDAFNGLDVGAVKNDELLDLIVDPEAILNKKIAAKAGLKIEKEAFDTVLEVRKELLTNPYTVFQIRELTVLKPVSKLYALENGKVKINSIAGKSFTEAEKLHPANFQLDNLEINERTLTAEEVLDSYKQYKKSKPFKLKKTHPRLQVGVWNIWHGGLHWNLEKDGWDSRKRIAEIIKEKDLDVVLMQETYSSGDFIAAELGYYFATTSDRDYRFQGANISVLSRYPIEVIKVSEQTEFNNVAVKLAISKSQFIWAMSNWYGMANFPIVYDFHASRFAQSDEMPVLFGGDFNAVPHTDDGDSPASKKLLDNSFTDAFRSLYPDVEKYPGVTHRNGQRIDQLYFKGKNLKLLDTEVISSWTEGYPSDHNLIVSRFRL
ncbi:MAG: endonuclease/exonuclease/phosphatase family protein [Bacteroidota bacterium]